MGGSKMRIVNERMYLDNWYRIATTDVKGVYNILDANDYCISSFLAKSDNAIRYGEYDFYIEEKIKQSGKVSTKAAGVL